MAQSILESGDSAFSKPLATDSVLKCGQEDSLEPADQDSEKAARSTAGSSDVLYWGQRNEYAVHLELGLSPMMARSHLVEFERRVLDCGHRGQGMGLATSRLWGTGE
ncbi:hypothetical protein V1525DRAFT_384805 [Lipomyces kononenkoae]|uniref:Uncharacterized protein n=1 Tax=Lipomyces kononenkoae TaxID=34357 RepID=A0ACC3TCN0_LIPKO